VKIIYQASRTLKRPSKALNICSVVPVMFRWLHDLKR